MEENQLRFMILVLLAKPYHHFSMEEFVERPSLYPKIPHPNILQPEKYPTTLEIRVERAWSIGSTDGR